MQLSPDPPHQGKRFEETAPEPQALKDYAQRVGAVRRNFRRYVIRENRRDLYHFEHYIISIAIDGTVTVREAHGGEVPEEIKPTTDEQQAIKVAFADPNWPPKSIGAVNTEALREKHVGEKAVLFEFCNQRNEIIFVQQRLFYAGGKTDLPWTFWSDGEWRLMEPLGKDDLLPLFGLQHLKPQEIHTVYLHEGAKTAWFLNLPEHKKTKWWQLRKVSERPWREACPWAADLVKPGVIHLGWPGGAPNPHRVDWSPLQKLSPHVRLIVVCDHDAAGENAVKFISHALQRRMSMLCFGGQFPRSFDLSDPFPETLYERNKQGERVYKRTAPQLQDCLEPATWATKANKQLRMEFVEEWLYSVQPALFFNRGNFTRRYIETEFNALVAPFSHDHLPNVAALLRRYPSAQAKTVAYNPEHKTGRITLDGERVINAYEPALIKPRPGDPKHWLAFMEYLVPDPQDRRNLLRWCATLIARPEVRIKYGVLLISETQGVGKTTLADILAPLVGYHNTSFPSAETVINSTFNTWQMYKRLVVIPEIYMGQTAKGYNVLKTYVTDDRVECEEKYVRAYTIQNWAHFLCTSNSFRALKLDDQDRRWFVPEIIEQKRRRLWFQAFRAWLFERDGLAIIAHWAQEYIKQHGHVRTGDEAPLSTAKRRTIEESRSDGERLVHGLGEQIKARAPQKVVVRLDKIRIWLAGRKVRIDRHSYGDDGRTLLETAETISKTLHGCGLKRSDKQFKTGGDRFRIVANFAIPRDAEWQDLAPHCVDPDQVDVPF
jgi:hypothetical protein